MTSAEPLTDAILRELVEQLEPWRPMWGSVWHGRTVTRLAGGVQRAAAVLEAARGGDLEKLLDALAAGRHLERLLGGDLRWLLESPVGRAVLDVLLVAGEDRTVRPGEAAQLLGVTRQRVFQMRTAGILTDRGTGVSLDSIHRRLSQQRPLPDRRR